MYCALGGGANKTNLLNIKHFFNTSSYFASRFTKSSRTIVNISLIASLALSQSLAAVTLPSGGKFVIGKGSIAINGNTMEITGKDTNHVIAWGGGFNIGKDASVNFTTSGKSYLNLDYTNKASQILGKLNGGTNNIYLVNPSGVLIGEGATINANKFGVSTTLMNMTAIDDFSDNGSFSPAFNTSKGDVVNMGTIKANEIVLVGNKVENLSGKLQGKDQDFANQVTIEGNKVYLEGVGIKATNLEATINEGGYFTHDTGILYEFYDKNKKKLDYSFKGNAVTNNNFKEYLYIGGKYADNDQMINSWTGFTNLFNDKKLQEWGFNDIYLGNDIDFDGKDEINPIGDKDNPFTANFYGNGYTLSNLKIKPSGEYAGLFGYINGGSVQDLTIDGLKFSPEYFTFFYKYIGGLAGYIKNGTFENITLENITGEIYSAEVIEGAGGFAGKIEGGDFDNIALNGIEDFNNEGIASGGFAGEIYGGEFNNISLRNLGGIKARDYAGGFAGKINDGIYSNIAIDTIKENTAEGGGFSIYANINTTQDAFAGGFAGRIEGGDFSNIVLNNIGGDISSSGGDNWSSAGGFAGGFAGRIDGGDFSDIVLNNIGDISSSGNRSSAGGFAGEIYGGDFSNIVLNNIENISSSLRGGISSKEYGSAGGFAGWIYRDSGDFSNIALNNIVNISGSGYTGGFAGVINSYHMTLSNIALNNIGKISGSNIRDSFSSAGGFTGGIYGYDIILSNIVLNNIGEISSRNSGSSDGFTGGFAGKIDGDRKVTLSNIVLNNIGNISGSGVNSSYAGGFAGEIDGSATLSNIYFYGAMNLSGNNTNQNHITSHKTTALNLTNTSDLQTIQNHMQDGSTLKNLEYVTGTNGKSYLHMVTNGNVGGEGSEITFDEENFTYNTPNIPEINPDGSGTSPLPEVSNEGELSDVVVGSGDFNGEILNSILGGTSLEFDLLSDDLESIRQSLDFLTAFLKDENTVNDYFDYIPNDNYDSDVHVKFKDKLQVFIENAIQNEYLNLEFLRDYRASLEKYNNDKKLYESGLLHPELQASLEKDLEKQYAELLGSKDKVDSMLGIFGDYKLILDKDKTIFTGNGSNLKFKVGIGELVNYKNTEGGGENNNNFNPPSDLSKQTELSSKEPILVLPAEETQNVIDEGERELGRVCIVSDNAKTSNPCIAIAF